MARILIDGRFIGVGESVGRYTLEILSQILKLDKKNHYTLLIRPQGRRGVEQYFGKLETNARYGILNTKYNNLEVQIVDIPHYSLAEQTALLKYLNKEKFDLVHFTQFNHPINYKGKYVTTIHDLTLFGHLHRQKNPLKKIAFGAVMKSAARSSRKVIAVSKTTKADVIEYYGIIPEKIKVVYCAIEDGFNIEVRKKQKQIDDFKAKHGIAKDYFLYTGMWKRHKNLIRMLKAYEIIIQKSKIKNQYENSKCKNLPQLVLLGKVDPNEPEVVREAERINKKLNAECRMPNAVVLTGYVEDEELPIATAGATAYVIPSLSEGFGKPPLEAMACGTPVISSKESCMPEVLGDAAYYFDPFNIKDMSQAMAKIFEDAKLRESLILKGFSQVKKYSWERAGAETLAVYKEVLGQD